MNGLVVVGKKIHATPLGSDSQRCFFFDLRGPTVDFLGGDWKHTVKPLGNPYLTLIFLLGQWLNFKLFGITCLVGKKKFKLFFQGPLAE